MTMEDFLISIRPDRHSRLLSFSRLRGFGALLDFGVSGFPTLVSVFELHASDFPPLCFGFRDSSFGFSS